MADPVIDTVGSPSTSTGNTTTSVTRPLPSTVNGYLNIHLLDVSPLANTTDPGVPAIDGTAISTMVGGTAGGWTTIWTSWDTGSPGPRLTAVARVRQPGDPTSVTISWASAGNHAAISLAIAAGSFDPAWLDSAAIQAQAASSTDFPTPTIAVVGRSRLFAAYGNRTGGGPWADALAAALVSSAQSASSANVALFDHGMVTPGNYTRTGKWTAATSVGNAGIFAIRAATSAAATQTSEGTASATGQALTAGQAVTSASTMTSATQAGMGATGAATASAATSVTAGPMTPVLTYLSQRPFHCAHRGGSKDWVEHTMNAYDQSHAWGVDALEASVWRSAEGTLWCSHDRSTGLVRGDGSTWCSTDVDIPSSTDAQIAAVRTNVGNYPLITLAQLLTKYGQSHIIFVDNKQNLNVQAFCDFLQTFPNATGRFVVKAYITATATAAEWKARGGQTWAYAYASNVDAGEVNATTVAPFTILGMDYNANQSYHDTLAAYGRIRMGHIIDSPSAKTTALNYGDQGMMASKIIGVVPQVPATAQASATGTASTTGTPAMTAGATQTAATSTSTTGAPRATGSATATATTSATTTAAPSVAGQASASAAGIATATATPGATGSAAASADTTVTTSASPSASGQATQTATGQAAGSGAGAGAGAATSTATGSATATGTPGLAGVATNTASTTTSTTGSSSPTGSATSSATTSTMATAAPTVAGSALSVGTSTLTAQVIALAVMGAAQTSAEGTASGRATTGPDSGPPMRVRVRLTTPSAVGRLTTPSLRGSLS